MRQLFIIDSKSVANGLFFLISVFRLYLGLKRSYEHISVRKSLFLSACFCWDSGIFYVRWTKNLNLMDSLVMEIFFWTLLFVYKNEIQSPNKKSKFVDSKVFRLHAILHDAAGAVRSHTGKEPGYCYMIGRGPKSGLVGPVTGLLFCLYVKFFLPSILNTVDF